VTQPAFVTAPINGQGVENGGQVQYLDEIRATALWRYLREDSLIEHLAEFG
jgi:hypothetical protein